MCRCDDENYLRNLIRDEVEKMRQEHLKKNSLQGNNLVALYLDNFPADRIKPSGATVAGQIKLVLKQIKEEELVTLLPILANAGKPVSAAWLNWAKDQVAPKAKATPPTWIPPKFEAEEFSSPESRPMPENFRDLVFRRSVDD